MNHTVSIKICVECQKETKNNKFCSRSCANSHNNRKIPKKKKKLWFCQKCGNNTACRRKFCKPCFSEEFLYEEGYDNLTICQLTRKRKYQKNSQIRELARKKMDKSGRPKICETCNYFKHVEVCHIKPIREFRDTDLIGNVNALSNMKYLCPNCHWEFDNRKGTSPAGIEPA